MARQLYTLAIANGTSVVPGYTSLNTCPDGFIWVVRDISVYFTDDLIESELVYWRFTIGGGSLPFWAPRPASMQSSRTYHWEGRQVINQGDDVGVETNLTDFGYSVNGYQLSTP